MAFCSAFLIFVSLVSAFFIIAFKYVKAFSRVAVPVFLCKYTSVNTFINDTCCSVVGFGSVVLILSGFNSSLPVSLSNINPAAA